MNSLWVYVTTHKVENILAGLVQLAYIYPSALTALFVITGYMLYFDRWKKKRAKALKTSKRFWDRKKGFRKSFMFSRNLP